MFRRLENELHRSSDQLDRDRERDRDFERDRDLDRDLKIGGRKKLYILPCASNVRKTHFLSAGDRPRDPLRDRDLRLERDRDRRGERDRRRVDRERDRVRLS